MRVEWRDSVGPAGGDGGRGRAGGAVEGEGGLSAALPRAWTRPVSRLAERGAVLGLVGGSQLSGIGAVQDVEKMNLVR